MIEDQILQIYRETIDVLYGNVSRRCSGNRDLAEDIVQETWLRAVRHWRLHGIPNKPLAWLTTVSRNLLLNEVRRSPSLRLDDVEVSSIPATCESENNSIDAAPAAVSEALTRLPERQSMLLRLFHFDRWRISRIAGSLKISERAVEGRLKRAREKLRRELERSNP
jgi:RNA polymerase sigma-70 factor (ECF subfamily)